MSFVGSGIRVVSNRARFHLIVATVDSQEKLRLKICDIILKEKELTIQTARSRHIPKDNVAFVAQ